MSFNIRGCFAELIATFALVFVGSLSVTASVVIFELSGPNYPVSILLIGLSHGLIISLMIYAIGHVSGGHINPAVTIPMIVCKKIGVADGVGYIIFQLIGALIGAGTHALLLPIGATVKYGLNTPGSFHGEVFSDGTVFGIEFLLTFMLVFVIFGTAVSGRAPPGWAGFAIGMTVALGHFIGVSISGASMNPARTFGPAVISWTQGLEGAFQVHYIYWIAPILGGLVAAGIYKYVFMSSKERNSQFNS